MDGFTLPGDVEIWIPTDADGAWQWNWIAGGAPVDMTGCTATLNLSITPDDAAPTLSVSTTANAAGLLTLGTAGGSNAGLVALALYHANNATLTAPVLHGDLVITLANGTEQVFLRVTAYVANGGPA